MIGHPSWFPSVNITLKWTYICVFETWQLGQPTNGQRFEASSNSLSSLVSDSQMFKREMRLMEKNLHQLGGTEMYYYWDKATVSYPLRDAGFIPSTVSSYWLFRHAAHFPLSILVQFWKKYFWTNAMVPTAQFEQGCTGVAHLLPRRSRNR